MIKLLIGGSPCTHWSIAQKNNRETEPKGLGWELFKNYLIAKQKFNPDFFLYENNKSAAQPIKDQISKELGVPLMHINSALVSAQNRQRFYAFNWEVEQPEDRCIILRDILECVDTEKEYATNSLTDRELAYMVSGTTGRYSDRWTYLQKPGENDKAVCITANIHRGVPYNILAEPAKGKKTSVYEVKDGLITINGKKYPIKLADGFYIFRKLTVKECCRLQTLPDDYCRAVSNSQAYKGLGNGWTAEVIIHILNGALKDVPKNEEIVVLSMYDGIGTGRYCLDKMGFTNVRYMAYEIDKYAKQVAMSNYSDIIQCGDAFDLRHPDWTIGY